MKKLTKKIKLATVETYLNKNLAPNESIIGVDVSMHSTGLAIIRTTDSYLILDYLHKIEVPKNIDILKATDIFLEQLDSYKKEIVSELSINKLVIEDCFFGNNVKTLKALARHGILVYERFRNIANNSSFQLPTQARNLINFKKSGKSIKGTKLKKEIMTYINNALDIDIKDNDIADAIVLALSGLVKEE